MDLEDIKPNDMIIVYFEAMYVYSGTFAGAPDWVKKELGGAFYHELHESTGGDYVFICDAEATCEQLGL